MLDTLYFISKQTPSKSHVGSVFDALQAGVRLIQLRVKNEPEEAVYEQALIARQMCNDFGARLIINDFPQVAKAVGAWGIHLGLEDLPVAAVRTIVGPDMIIGGTANTFEHVQQRAQEGVNYIGLGPYRFTLTKEKLSPVLGLEGFQRILQQMKEADISIPVVAIGGITPEDQPGLLKAGVKSVAVSGAIADAGNKEKVVKQFMTTV